MTAETLNSYSAKDLAEMAKTRGVRGWHSMRKDQLIKALLKIVREKANKSKAHVNGRAATVPARLASAARLSSAGPPISSRAVPPSRPVVAVRTVPVARTVLAKTMTVARTVPAPTPAPAASATNGARPVVPVRAAAPARPVSPGCTVPGHRSARARPRTTPVPSRCRWARSAGRTLPQYP